MRIAAVSILVGNSDSTCVPGIYMRETFHCRHIINTFVVLEDLSIG